MPYNPKYKNSFKYGLCECHKNCDLCIESVLCFYCLAGYVSHETTWVGGEDGKLEAAYCNEGCYATFALDIMQGWLLNGMLLSGMRDSVGNRYKIYEGNCVGYLSHCFCPFNALTQVAAELRAHSDWNGSCFTGPSTNERETTQKDGWCHAKDDDVNEEGEDMREYKDLTFDEKMKKMNETLERVERTQQQQQIILNQLHMQVCPNAQPVIGFGQTLVDAAAVSGSAFSVPDTTSISAAMPPPPPTLAGGIPNMN